MKTDVELSPQQYRLKAATRALIRRCGGLEAAALVCRVRKSMLHRYADNQCADAFMPADVALALEREIGEPVVTAAIADMLGLELRRKSDSAPGGGDSEACPVDLGVENSIAESEYLREAREAKRDGRLTPAELDRLISRCEGNVALEQRRLRHLAALRARAGGLRVVKGGA